MTQPWSVTTRFRITETFRVTILANQYYGRGKVTSSPAGIDCTLISWGERTGACDADFPNGSTVVLTATPSDGGTFGSWGGECTSANGATCTLEMTKPYSFFVNIQPQTFPITVLAGAGSNGSGVTRLYAQGIPSPAVACPIQRGVPNEQFCTGQVPYGAKLNPQEIVVPFNGTSALKGVVWSTCASGTGCTVTGPSTYTVTFHARETTIRGAGSGSGRVVSTTASIDCHVAGTTTTGACSKVWDASSANPPYTATPDPGSEFIGWSGQCAGTGPCSTFGEMPPNVYLTAQFERTGQPLTVTGAGTGTGTVTQTNGDIACNISAGVATGTCSGAFADGTIVRLEAVAASGSQFIGWEGACTGTNTCAVTMSEARAVTARFQVAEKWTVSLASAVNYGRGTVVSNPAGIDCTFTGGSDRVGVCFADFPAGSSVVLTATPKDGSTFSSFNSCPSASGVTCTLEMTRSYGLIPVFEPLKFPLTVVAGAGSNGTGVVRLYAAELQTPIVACSITRGVPNERFCTGQMPLGAYIGATDITTPFEGTSRWTSAVWNMCPPDTKNCTATGPSTFTMTLLAKQTTVRGSGTGSGRVVSTGGHIDCAVTATTATGTCMKIWDATHATPRYTATPDAGSVFAGWLDQCTGTAPCDNLGADPPNVYLTARFELSTAALTVTGTGSGSVTSSPDGITCTIVNGATSGTCAAAFNSGTTVTLTPTPAAGWTFAGWSGACIGTGTCQPSLSENRSVAAAFTRVQLALTVAGGGTGDGKVTSAPGNMSCTITKGVAAATGCNVTADQNATVTLTAVPQAGSTFAGWDATECSGTSLTCQLTLAQARTITARFTAPRAARDIALALLGAVALTADERTQLDLFGNKDGTFNLGDLLALLDRTGERLTPATMNAVMSADTPMPTMTPRRTP